MSAYLIFLNTQTMVWDYASNRQWLDARSQRIIYTNRATVHAVVIEANETLQEIHDFMGETLSNVDDFEVIPLAEAELTDSGDDILLRWLGQRDDWKEWCASHK
jgi:hypothetical protein